MMRSTYPAGQTPLGVAPKLLNRTPTSVADVMSPGTVLGTQFAGPLVSGPAPGVAGAIGATALALCLQIDGSMGNFNISIPFPGGSLLTSIDAFTLAGPTPGAYVQIGTQPTTGDIAAVPLPALGAIAPRLFPSVQLPLWGAVAPVAPFTAWLNVTTNTPPTTSVAVVVLNYIRLTPAW